MGSITLSRGGTSITLTDGLSVQRSVGRPQSELRPRPGPLPNYTDKQRPASDIWEISGEFTTSTAGEDVRTLQEDILRPPLGRGTLTLTFDNSLFGLGSYDVFPAGSQAGRISYAAGETGYVTVEKITLQVVDNS